MPFSKVSIKRIIVIWGLPLIYGDDHAGFIVIYLGDMSGIGDYRTRGFYAALKQGPYSYQMAGMGSCLWGGAGVTQVPKP